MLSLTLFFNLFASNTPERSWNSTASDNHGVRNRLVDLEKRIYGEIIINSANMCLDNLLPKRFRLSASPEVVVVLFLRPL